MNERLPYEEQLTRQLNDLPLPGEDMAWEDMKRRLEEDDDDTIPPFWLRGCGLWGLLGIILLGLGWWLFRPDKWWAKKQLTENVRSIDPKKNTDTIHVNKPVPVLDNTGKKETTVTTKHVIVTPVKTSSLNPHTDKRTTLNIAATAPSTFTKNKGSKDSRLEIIQSNRRVKKQGPGKKNQTAAVNNQVNISIAPPAGNKETEEVKSKTDPPGHDRDSSTTITTITSKPDTAHKISTDTTHKKAIRQPVKGNEQKKDSSTSKNIWFSAGFAMQQLLPVEGQKPVPYNSEGRKGSLGDYIPSVYFRMYKKDKWFLQAEFRYGAPQYSKEILYRQNIKIDTILGSTTTTSTKLKKTFYHQLPFSFNYFVLPNWSIGTGIVWNKFSSAVAEQQVNKKNNLTQLDSILSIGIIRDRNDSAFVKSYFQALLETQYRWRRFSVGARYSFGLQPFIKFTLPGGSSQQERNRSLQVFLRYELWRTKR